MGNNDTIFVIKEMFSVEICSKKIRWGIGTHVIHVCHVC